MLLSISICYRLMDISSIDMLCVIGASTHKTKLAISGLVTAAMRGRLRGGRAPCSPGYERHGCRQHAHAPAAEQVASGVCHLVTLTEAEVDADGQRQRQQHPEHGIVERRKSRDQLVHVDT